MTVIISIMIMIVVSVVTARAAIILPPADLGKPAIVVARVVTDLKVEAAFESFAPIFVELLACHGRRTSGKGCAYNGCCAE
jgi:hypothetical protein